MALEKFQGVPMFKIIFLAVTKPDKNELEEGSVLIHCSRDTIHHGRYVGRTSSVMV